ncbi:unnamed protein product [Phaedon cochleariae]|uniref:DNA polymerase delta subunit 3 n=1 Tax=Phaedon cochleariae TaxID=80249 RepID=A0A9P0DHJ9_PHACE|nr:unnamed protein product [Phaedon cochleariae]
MDSATEELYFQKLQELVYDNDKIVTIPSLARTLDISVQESQHLIKQFTEDQNKLKPDQLTVTYVLTGLLKHGNGRAVLMLTQPTLTEKRSTFEQVLSEVIFSIQKCKSLDFNIIALVDGLDSTTICDKPLSGSIVGENCVKGELRTKKLPSPRGPTIKGKSSFFLPKTETTGSTVKPSQSTDSSSKAKPTGGTANIFSKASTSNPVTKEKSKGSENKPIEKPKGGLSGFLTKSSSRSISSNENIKCENGSNKDENSDQEKKSTEIESADSIKLEDDLSSSMDIDVEEIKKVVEVKEETKTFEKSQQKRTKKETKSKPNKNKRQREKSEEKPTKRRKRIVERNDSESDDMFENDADEDIIDKSDEEPERIPSPVEKKPLAPKNKIRRAVDKTYEDEEGFIVTKTEYVYETASEDENETPVQNVGDKPKEKKIEKKNSASSENDVSPKKGTKSKKGKKNDQNQPTLMNFFKKK